MGNLSTIIEAVAEALPFLQSPEPDTYGGIGRIVDSVKHGEELGVDRETLRRHEVARYEGGLSRYDIAFSCPVGTDGGRVKAVAVPVAFAGVAKEHVGKMSTCDFARDSQSGVFVATEIQPFVG